jgi:murein L,D-transpeptidase YafK
MKNRDLRSKFLALAFAACSAFALVGCEDDIYATSGRSLRAIPSDTIALMAQKETSASAPVLIRTYKKEAEFEIWKMKSDGRYTLLKTFPMCRWSGQLGPKTREGDRQVPEGFYPITPGQMNPNSNYYLSFNVGYPNAYDRAFGRTGGSIMVHGACSSAGCFSMTDAQIAEIYAIAREAFNGGQREIQMQSYPFHMTAENLAKHRLDPNIDFWKQLKNGSDHFDVTLAEPQVGVCGRRYVFGARAENGGELDASMACPALHRDETVEALVAEKQQKDEIAVAELVRQGVKPVEVVYADGGQNASFIGQRGDVSRPDAITAGPTEIVLDDQGKPVPAVVKVAEAQTAPAESRRPVASNVEWAPVAPAGPTVAAAKAPEAQPAPASASGGVLATTVSFIPSIGGGPSSDSDKPFYKKWIGLGGSDDSNTVQALEYAQPIPADVPLPPRRDASRDAASKPQAMLTQKLVVTARAAPAVTAPVVTAPARASTMDAGMAATAQ